MKAVFLRALEETENKHSVLREAITSPEQAMGQTRFDVDPGELWRPLGSSQSATEGACKMALNEKQQALCDSSRWDFSDLTALFLNCTLKRSPELSHTEGLMNISKAIMETNGMAVEMLRPVDSNIAYGVYPHDRARLGPG